MNVAIDIPDEIGRVLAAQAGGVTRAVLGAVAIEWDAARGGQLPLVILDGREFTWDELGRMPMTYEGRQFQLEIRDQSEEF